MNKETDICFCQNVRFLFGICSLESHCSEGGFTPLLFRQQTKTLFRQAWNAHAGSFGVTSAMILI